MGAQKHIFKHKLFCSLKARVARRITDSLEGPQEYVWPFTSVQSRDSCTWLLRALSGVLWHFENLQAWRLHSLSGQRIPVFVHPHSGGEGGRGIIIIKKKRYKNWFRFKWDLPCFSLCPLPPVLSLDNTEKSFAPSYLLLPSFIHIDGIPPSKTNLSQFSQPLLIWQEGLQSLNHVTGSSGTL